MEQKLRYLCQFSQTFNRVALSQISTDMNFEPDGYEGSYINNRRVEE